MAKAQKKIRSAPSASIGIHIGRGIFPLADASHAEHAADLLTQRLVVHEQTAWMLRSLLEE